MPAWPRKKKFTLVARGLLGLLCWATPLGACPELMPTKNIPWFKPSKIKRNQLQLFAQKAGAWTRLGFQMDPMDKDGDLIFPVAQDWQLKTIAPNDRLSFSPSEFGDEFNAQNAFPCKTTQIFEIQAGSKYAYLAVCSEPSSLVEPESPVFYDEKRRLMRTNFYRYHYSERNHLVFDEILLADREFKVYEKVASRSDLVIVGDVRNFFTMVFDSEDFDAKINYQRKGSVGLVGGLQFFLNVLAFRIKLALLPEVNFFDDALYMPMTMYLPVDATKYLRPGSGVYYSWDKSPDAEWLLDASDMEVLDPQSLSPDFKGPLLKPNPRFCTNFQCKYNLKGKVRGRAFSLDFGISREAADLGFFPRIIKDLRDVEKITKRAVSRFPAPGRIGVFFETSRLPMGTHKWDFWIRIETDKEPKCGDGGLRFRPISFQGP